jgi:hypothetical protein
VNPISRIAALLRLSYEEELTDDVRDQIREHCSALRDVYDKLAKAERIAYERGQRDLARRVLLELSGPWDATHGCALVRVLCQAILKDPAPAASESDDV